MYALGLCARWLHLASSILLVGAATTIALAGRSDRPTARRWEHRVLLGSRGLALAALGSGLIVLGLQTALFEGRGGAALEAGSIARVLIETQAGRVWLVRFGLLAILAAFLWSRLHVESSLDWRAARAQAMLLGAAALVPAAAAGHAAAVEPETARAIALDGLHVLGAGVWVGGLLPLALLLWTAAAEPGADARPYAVLAARRFSRLALGVVLVLVATGTLMAIANVGNVAGLVGTAYGRLLLAKLGLVVAALALAAVNRAVHLGRLAGDGPTVGRPAMRRLATFLVGEGLIALVVLAIVATMTVTPPARHEAPTWPFSVRLSFAALEGAPAASARVLIGSQIAVLGLVGLAAGLAIRGRRLPLVAGALVVLGAGVGLALPPLAVDAYPTTYLRPSVPYHAASIASGATLYREHCAACHGAGGAGDAPAGLRLARPPADLRGPHTALHTAGDLFWWLTNGIPEAGMPAFGRELGEEQRWDLVNFLRALSSGYSARGMRPAIEPDRPWLVAPDFTFAVGPTPPRSLREYRGRRTVLLVLYELARARSRLAEIAGRDGTLALLGVEVIAVPVDAAPDAIKRIGPEPRVLFSVVTEGAQAIVTAYHLLAASPHVEFLIDRQGYIRAVTRGSGAAGDLDKTIAEVQRLNEERTAASAPEEHVH